MGKCGCSTLALVQYACQLNSGSGSTLRPMLQIPVAISFFPNTKKILARRFRVNASWLANFMA